MNYTEIDIFSGMKFKSELNHEYSIQLKEGEYYVEYYVHWTEGDRGQHFTGSEEHTIADILDYFNDGEWIQILKPIYEIY